MPPISCHRGRGWRHRKLCPNQPLVWQQSHFGGGGFITGLILDPKTPDILYARCDVAGVFKSVDGGQHWRGIKQWPDGPASSVCAIHRHQPAQQPVCCSAPPATPVTTKFSAPSTKARTAGRRGGW